MSELADINAKPATSTGPVRAIWAEEDEYIPEVYDPERPPPHAGLRETRIGGKLVMVPYYA